MPISKETPIQISLGSALCGAGALAVLTLTGVSFMFSQVKDDVSATRFDVSEIRQAAREDGQSRTTSDAALRQSLSDLTAQLQATTLQLSEVSESLASLDNSIRTVDDKLSASITRQQEFERAIVARLDPIALDKQGIPAEWFLNQRNIITEIAVGGDPLAGWYNALVKD